MTQREKCIEATRNRLEKAALDYARMKTFGIIMEGDTVNRFTHGDVKMWTEQFLSHMATEAIHLLTQLANVELPPRSAT